MRKPVAGDTAHLKSDNRLKVTDTRQFRNMTLDIGLLYCICQNITTEYLKNFHNGDEAVYI